MTMWNEHVNTYRAKHPTMSYKQCLQNAALTYKKQSGKGLKLAGEGALIKSSNPKMLEDAARIVVKYTKHLVSGDLAKLRDNLIKVYGDKLLRGKMHVGGSYGCGLGLAGGSVNWSALWAKALTLISQAPVKKIAKAGAALAGKQAKKLAKKALEDPEKAIDVISTGYDLGKSIKTKGIRNSGKEVAQIKDLAEGKITKITKTTKGAKVRPNTVRTAGAPVSRRRTKKDILAGRGVGDLLDPERLRRKDESGQNFLDDLERRIQADEGGYGSERLKGVFARGKRKSIMSKTVASKSSCKEANKAFVNAHCRKTKKNMDSDMKGGFLIEFARSIAPSLLNTALEKTGLMKSFPPAMRKHMKTKAGMDYVMYGNHPKGSDLEKLQKHLLKQKLKKGGSLKLAGGMDQMKYSGDQEGGFVITTALLIAGSIAAAKALATGALIAVGGLAVESIVSAAKGSDPTPKTEVEYEYVDQDGNAIEGSGVMGKTVKMLKPALKEVEKTVSEGLRAIKSVPVKNVKGALTTTALKSAETLVKKVKQGAMTAQQAIDDYAKKHVSKALEKELDKSTIGSGLDGECEGAMVGSGFGSLARAGIKAGARALPKLAKKVVKRVVKVVTKVGSKASKGLKAVVKKIKPTKIKIKPPSSSGYTPSWQQQFDSVSKIPSKVSKVDFSAAREIYANDPGMLSAMDSFSTVLR